MTEKLFIVIDPNTTSLVTQNFQDLNKQVYTHAHIAQISRINPELIKYLEELRAKTRGSFTFTSLYTLGFCLGYDYYISQLGSGSQLKISTDTIISHQVNLWDMPDIRLLFWQKVENYNPDLYQAVMSFKTQKTKFFEQFKLGIIDIGLLFNSQVQSRELEAWYQDQVPTISSS